MTDQKKIKSAFERLAKIFKDKPGMAKDVCRSTTRIRQGLDCEIQEGDFKLNATMAESAGGSGVYPTPGVLGRAALGSCLAIGYKMWASKLEIPIKSLEIEIEADVDSAGLYGTADVAPGYSEVRYSVRIESLASEADINTLLEHGDKHSPYLDIFSRSICCKRQTTIIQSDSV